MVLLINMMNFANDFYNRKYCLQVFFFSRKLGVIGHFMIQKNVVRTFFSSRCNQNFFST